jgi:phosphoglycerate dehydrogenase-like enzyme
MKDNNRLLILTPYFTQYAELISELGLENLEIIACDTVEKASRHVETCNIILGRPSLVAPILHAAKSLQWFQSTFAGVETLVDPPVRTDYVLTGVKGVFGPLMSEYIFAYILAMERNLFQVYENQRRKAWVNLWHEPLQGKLMGICGLGSIGRHVAQTARHFGMRVWGFKRSNEAVSGVERVFTRAEWREFLTSPDYVVLTLPNTPETYHLMDGEAFQAMKPSAVLINVGRGSVVLEQDLVYALEAGLIGGAVLDVFEEEPLSPESRLWSLPNVFITPHNAAVSFPQDIVQIFADNYCRFVEGKPLRYVIDFDRGY